MKTKMKLLRGFVPIMLAALMTGCCTPKVIDKFKEKTTDTFNPSAVYRSTSHNGFVLEGMRQNYSRNTNKLPFHAYLIIPQDRLASWQLQTNRTLTLEQIKTLHPTFWAGLKMERTLSADWEKVADLPNNDIKLTVKTHRPYSGVVVLLPVAISMDAVIVVVTLPITVPMVIYLKATGFTGS